MMNINSISHRHTISIGTHKEIIQTRKWRLRIRLINLAYVILLHRWRPCKHGQLTTDEMRHMEIGQFFPIFLGGRWGWLIFFPVSPFLSCHNNVFRHQMKNSPRTKQQHTSQSSKMEFREHNRSGTSTMRKRKFAFDFWWPSSSRQVICCRAAGRLKLLRWEQGKEMKKVQFAGKISIAKRGSTRLRVNTSGIWSSLNATRGKVKWNAPLHWKWKIICSTVQWSTS